MSGEKSVMVVYYRFLFNCTFLHRLEIFYTPCVEHIVRLERIAGNKHLE